ncbi:50S ribosomal protein L24 [Candidatus Woesearchaeota archaeon]|nr:50S ribosomal protein L24P [uncultured archaeon]MBS3153186.1 50S ribosomal protein L24 [Candidatus Woesearchaeota archaeon]
MKQIFSLKWRSSRQPRKRRKFQYNAPLHIKHKFLGSHLSKELIKKYGKRSFPIRKGDTVKIQRGQYKGKSGKIEKVLLKETKVWVEGISLTKRDGSKSFYPIHPSNLLITELDLTDKKRKGSLERKNGTSIKKQSAEKLADKEKGN